ncbi:MAG: diaminopimelate decarboxylase [Thermosulfidibacteraceae bacterium]|jgi:diaminopimelate decarboxylase
MKEIGDYRNGSFFVENVDITEIAKEVGTPFYVYSLKGIRDGVKDYKEALSEYNGIGCYAVKANSNIALMKIIFNEGFGADVVSKGELYKALIAGVDPSKTVFAGVGKRDDEIEFALEKNILMFNVESEEELYTINDIAGRMQKKARIAIRVNPDVDPKTHPYIATGLKTSKFGIDINDAYDMYIKARELENIEIIGIHYHIGSQITKKEPFIEAGLKVIELVKSLKEKGINIKYFDMGGGIGIRYNQEETIKPKDIMDELGKYIKELELIPIMEPGRSIIGNAGFLVTKLLYIKRKNEKNFYIVDAGMNDLARPALYDAYHEIVPAKKKNNENRIIVDIVGPICESGDFLAKNREMPVLNGGDLLIVKSTGAYGFSMSSNYNMRPKVAEVLVDEDRWYVIRKRETLEDLIRGENIPSFLL